MDLSIGTAPGPGLVDLAVRAEELGYERLWVYDSPAIYEDIWIHLAECASATTRIGLGSGVLVPGMRHVMVTASAIATMERLAPGRMAYGFGTGYTGRLVLGKKAHSWKFTRTYVEQLKALLAGGVVEIDGEQCQMVHHPDFAVGRPIDVPILLSAFGPKGQAITEEIADGWMGMSPPPSPGLGEWGIHMVNGTVLDPGESPRSDRVIEAAGPWQVGSYHFLWESGPEMVAMMPGGAEWLAQIDSERPAPERHLAVHSGHVTNINTADRIGIDACGDELAWHGWVGEAAEIAAKAAETEAAGTTELMYTPAGPDPIREIEAFHAALT